MITDVIKKKIEEAKTMAVINGESLEIIYASILDDADKMIAQKRTQIERIIGEITQLSAMQNFLFKALDRYLIAKKNTESFRLYEEQMMKTKKEAADKRIQEALQEDGLDPDGNIVHPEPIEKDVKIDIHIPVEDLLPEDKTLIDKKKIKIKRV